GDPSHHTGPAWIILNRHPLGTRPRQIKKVHAENHCMVSKSGPDLQRRDRGRAPRNLAQSDFFHVPAEPRQYKNSAPYLEPNGKCTRSRRMNRPKSSSGRSLKLQTVVSPIRGRLLHATLWGSRREADGEEMRPSAVVEGAPYQSS